jgi:Xaa-Pro aminopeptidase
MEQNNCISAKIADLRDLFSSKGIDGYYVPSHDEYLLSFCPKETNRLEYITGFSGSNGMAFITKAQVLFLTDSRYIAQANDELQGVAEVMDLKEGLHLIVDQCHGKIIGYDPALMTMQRLNTFSKINWQPIIGNLVDSIWSDKPLNKKSKVYEYKLEYSGMHFMQKLEHCYFHMKDNEADYFFISDICSINWLLNIRAQDVEWTPVLLSYLLIGKEQIYLFGNDLPNRLKNFTHSEWDVHINYYDINNMQEVLSGIVGDVIIELNSCPLSIISGFKKATLINLPNILLDLKACKNEVEISLAISGHMQDAQSLCEVFAFVNQKDNIGNFTEKDIAALVQKARSQHNNYVCESFNAICGYKANSAIVHYSPYKNPSNVNGNGVLLLDTGAQYLGCTTDVTRTFLINNQIDGLDQELLEEIRHIYTLVLKGHIALAKAKFPKGTLGSYLDSLARQFLYDECENYGHGTGHGVGSFLAVHESPPSISTISNHVVKKGMIFSNEPGYYKTNYYGIRIENLCLVIESNKAGFLELQQLTLLPYCFALIKWDLITLSEKNYLKTYYLDIKIKVLPNLCGSSLEWCKGELDLVLNLVN